MLVLDSINKSITANLSGVVQTNNPSFVTAYSDDNGTTFIEGSSDGVLNGVSEVTLVSAPAASVRRLIKTINIENNDTAAVTLTVSFVNNGSSRIIAKVTLQSGDRWNLDSVVDANGNIKGIGVSGYSGISGYSGFSGQTGASGFSGISGFSGAVGATGASGYSGFSGFSGAAAQITYPSAGIAVSTGSAWGTSKTSPSGTIVGDTDSQTLSSKTLTNPTVTNYIETLYAPAAGSAFTVDLTNGTVQKLTSNANLTITLPASVAGKSYIIIVAYGGAHTLTWAGGSTIKWASGTTPTATSTSGKFDIFSFFCDGTNTYGQSYGLNF